LSKTGDRSSVPVAVKSNLHLLIGDSFLRAQKSKAIAAETEKKAGGSFARQSFRLEETPLETVLATARTLPFLSEGQILYVQGADLLKEQDLAVLEAYLQKPSPQTVLVFETEEAKAVTGLAKLVKSYGQVLALAKEETRTAGAAFIQQKLAGAKKTITPGAKARLLEMCGDAVVFLDSMLDRLAQFADEKSVIDEAMVARFEENWTEMDVFKLTNAFLARDRARILKVFRDLMDFYEADLISLVGILHWQLRQLWQAAFLLERGASERDVCSRCKMPPSRMAALRKFPVKVLESAIEALYQIDKKAKTGQVEGMAAVEAWLLRYSA